MSVISGFIRQLAGEFLGRRAVSALRCHTRSVGQFVAGQTDPGAYCNLCPDFACDLCPNRTCNLCGYRGHFLASGRPKRYDARCPECSSLERHRLLMLWINANRRELVNRRLLHFMPQGAMAAILRPLAGSHGAISLNPSHGDLPLGAEAFALPDRSADVVVCSHARGSVVDHRALAGLMRVLADQGLALIIVSLAEDRADPSGKTPFTHEVDRGQHLGASRYPRDDSGALDELLLETGFDLEEFIATEPEIKTYGLIGGDKVLVVRKYAPPDEVMPAVLVAEASGQPGHW